jgi:hypothetical protein
MDGHDLSVPVAGHFVPIGKPGKQQARMSRLFTVTDDILTGSEFANGMRQGEDCVFVLLIELHPQLKLPRHWT